MQDRFKFRVPMFTDKGTFCEFQYIELGDIIECTLCGSNGMPQQCMGLKDKNGSLIYEGDIVQILGDEEPYVIEFEQDRAMFIIHSQIDRICCNFDNYNGSELEVIANIYKNPELLEGRNEHQ